MGFLERTRSQRARHSRTRSGKIEEIASDATSGQPKYTTKRKSIFPGLSSNNTSEGSRPRAASARTSFSQTAATDRATLREDAILPPNTSHFASNYSFKCPSPALVNDRNNRTAPTSVAHLPTMPINSATFSPGPKSSTTAKPPVWNRAVTDPVLSTMQRESSPNQANTWQSSDDNPQRPQIRKQKSAWKSFGDLFRNKQMRQPVSEQFYQVQPSSKESRSKGAVRGRVGVLESPPPSPAVKDERIVARVDSGRESLEPPRGKGLDNLVTPTPAGPFPPRTSSRNPSNDFIDKAADTAEDVDETLKAPRLDIKLPGSNFDRYSVMFEKLLEPKPKASLLERRQSKRASCQAGTSPVNPPDISQPSGNLQRSLTSPSLTRMPSLTIKIANSNYAIRSTGAQKQQKAPVTLQPRTQPKRSMTAPSGTLSPLTVPSKGTTPLTARAIPLPESSTTASSRRCSILSENSLPPTPNTAVSLASSIETTIFGSGTSTPSKAVRVSMQQTSTPKRPSASPPPIPSRSEERPQRPALLRNYPSGSEPFNRQIVQVSVARQVSVSKARRRVADAVEVKQPLRPKVVELGKNRKSTLVMIESGDS